MHTVKFGEEIKLFSWNMDSLLLLNNSSREIDKCVISTYIDTIDGISSPNPMFDHLLESSLRDDSNKGSNIEFSENLKI